jgi:hypothetical protein
MNRLLAILVSLFILFLVYLWINHITTDPWSSDQPDTFSITEQEESARTPYPENTVQESVDKSEQTDQADAEEKAEDENADAKNVPPADEPRTATDKVESPPETTSRPVESERKMTLTPEQQHLVIAGNFLERSNAEKRVRELQGFGYANAEVVNFQLSEYHTACAGRYANLDEAQRIARRLKSSHSIDAYVRHGN